MADDITKTAEQLESENKMTEAEKRIKQLSEKVRLTSEERDEKDRLLKEESDKRASAERERDFYANFSDMVATNPAAKDHKEDILSKVKGGYTVQDATYAVLGAAGKLGGTGAPPQPTVPVSPAGGSATTQVPQSGDKAPTEMSLEEKRAALAKELTWS